MPTIASIKRFLEKPWFFTAALCLVALVSSFVIGSGNHRVSEECSTEIVEFEECEEFVVRKDYLRRKEDRPALRFKLQIQRRHFETVASQTVFFKPMTERDCHNGIGAYLRT